MNNNKDNHMFIDIHYSIYSIYSNNDDELNFIPNEKFIILFLQPQIKIKQSIFHVFGSAKVYNPIGKAI